MQDMHWLKEMLSYKLTQLNWRSYTSYGTTGVASVMRQDEVCDKLLRYSYKGENPRPLFTSQYNNFGTCPNVVKSKITKEKNKTHQDLMAGGIRKCNDQNKALELNAKKNEMTATGVPCSINIALFFYMLKFSRCWRPRQHLTCTFETLYQWP